MPLVSIDRIAIDPDYVVESHVLLELEYPWQLSPNYI
jgi:hypothetical protein